jgi:RsiW-degrading membrane proteinase PrsW (M82 family)
MSYSILVASVIPLLFLYLIKWLNFFETHRVRLVVLALAWGAVSLWLSYVVDHSIRMALDAGDLGKQIVSTHYAPFVEEIFKSLILLYLVRRGDTTFFVDGAVYGFAAGIGFAIPENMLYLSRVDLATGEIVGTVRAFVSSVMHGSTTAIVGMALAGFPMGGLNKHPLAAWGIGLTIAISAHMAYNNTAFHHFVFGQTGVVVLAVLAFAALLLVGIAILWGLRREQRLLRKSIGMSGMSKGEAMLVERLEDIDDLLAPVEERFGELKREQVADALRLGAQLAMKQEQIRSTRDEELRTELAAQVTQLKRELRQQRHEVGMYVMSYARSILPKTTWSLWAHLGRTLSNPRPAGMNLWSVLTNRLVGHNSTEPGMHARIRAELESRGRAAALAVESEE